MRLGAASLAAGGQLRLLLRGGCAPLGAAAPPVAACSTLAPYHMHNVRAASELSGGDAAPGEQPPSSAGAPSDKQPDSGKPSAEQAQTVAEAALRQLRLKLAAAEGGSSSSSSSSSSDARLGEVLVAVADWALAQERGAAAELLLQSLAALTAAVAGGGSGASDEDVLELIGAIRGDIRVTNRRLAASNELLEKLRPLMLLNDARTRIAAIAGLGSGRSGGSLELMCERYERPFLLDWALATMLRSGRTEVDMAAADIRASAGKFTQEEYRQIEGLDDDAEEMEEEVPDWDGSRREARRAAFVRELSHVTGIRFRSEQRGGKAGPEPAWWVCEEPADSSGDAEDQAGSGSGSSSGSEADGTG
ncbi:hypothetical protein HXX76_007662 [Chlamydomonas incerta]|uniref:Uncharacterized protein n=1 Tax=Chlamydomonas incerta TaxID=51695 RepID=A0A835T0E6_CHLIN|nr:hypothetical protein HXX76_007662 [Chlamydomonas incerta]|eukprot:KAG2434777.1 hypothetical protein HXX76_007662 [Chlamydomonas incerta]